MERNFESTTAGGYDIATQLQNSLSELFAETMAFIPELVAAIVIVVIGWIVGGLLGGLVAKAFRTLHLDKALDKAGVDDLSRRAGYAFKPAKFAGGLVKWFIILAFLTVALNVLGLTSVTDFIGDILAYLPKVLAAALILFFGLIAARAIRSIAEGAIRSAKTVDSSKADTIGNVTYYAVIAFAAMAALNQMDIAPELIQILFTAVTGALALGFGLAFGLGGKDAAARYIEKMDDAAKKEAQGNTPRG
jgi:small-conductance mechanosensitive channel